MATLLDAIQQISEEKEEEILTLRFKLECAQSDIGRLKNEIIDLKNANFRLKTRLKLKSEKSKEKSKPPKEKPKKHEPTF